MPGGAHLWQHPTFHDVFGRALAASHYAEGATDDAQAPVLLKQLTSASKQLTSALSNFHLGSIAATALSLPTADVKSAVGPSCLGTLITALDFVASMLPPAEATMQTALRECSSMATRIAEASTSEVAVRRGDDE